MAGPLHKMLPPHNRPLAELAAEEGISEATLYNWRHDARDHGRLLPDTALTILFDGATNMVIE